ncbi:MAG: sigma-70 family RNA polymerase sigma factor [bacterium]
MDTNKLIKDEELVNDVLAGNNSAFNQLVSRYFGMVYMIGYARFKRREAGEDLAQETFLHAFLHLEKLQQPRLFAAWISRIARNLATDWQRKSQRVSKIIPLIPMEELPKDIADTQTQDVRIQTDSKTQQQIVQEAILKLPAELREIVLLYYSEGLTRQEIAQILGIHPSTVGRQIRKSLSILKGILEPVLRESMQSLRSSEKVMLRSIAIISAAVVLSASSKAALVTAAADIVQDATISLIKTTGSGITEVLKNALKPKKVYGIKQSIAVTIIVAAVIGGIYYYESQKRTNKEPRVNDESFSPVQIPQKGNTVLAMAENHDRIIGNAQAEVYKDSPGSIPTKMDGIGYYDLYGGGPDKYLYEIYRNNSGALECKAIVILAKPIFKGSLTLREVYHTNPCEQQGDSIIFSREKAPMVWRIRSDGKTVDITPGITKTITSLEYIIANIGQRIDDARLWNAVHSYYLQEYANAEPGFRQYLQSHSEDLYARLLLTDTLIALDKLDEAKSMFKIIEKNPEIPFNKFYKIMVQKIKYLLTGKEKSLAHQNVYDDYLALLDSNRSPFFHSDFTAIRNIVNHTAPFGNKEKRFLQEFMGLYPDYIIKFTKLTQTKYCYVPDDVKNIMQLPGLAEPINLYGRFQAEEGNIQEAIKAHSGVIRFGQQITYGNIMQCAVGSLLRQYGELGLKSLFTDNKITNPDDIEFVYMTLKELRKSDPQRMENYGYGTMLANYNLSWEDPFVFKSFRGFKRGEPWTLKDYGNGVLLANYGSSWDGPSDFAYASFAETNLIILETAAAVKLYQLQQGTYPSKMQDLIPKYLSHKPMDTFGMGNTINIVLSSQGIVVYDNGPDNTDDKGLLIYDPTNGIWSKGDLVIEMK